MPSRLAMPEICLQCKKSFKRPRPVFRCPECHETTYRVHPNFRAPKATARKEWEVVELLVRNGFDFSGWVRKKDAPGPTLQRPGYPRTLRDAHEFMSTWAPATDPDAP
jgi:hypothetical protein